MSNFWLLIGILSGSISDVRFWRETCPGADWGGEWCVVCGGGMYVACGEATNVQNNESRAGSLRIIRLSVATVVGQG